MDSKLEARIVEHLDHQDILRLVARERFARDQKHYELMRACFHDDARITTSWFDGGAEDYVQATIRVAQSERVKRDGSNSKHWVFPGHVRLNGDRATVESPALIFNRVLFDGVLVDTRVFCRFFSRVLRRASEWKLLSFEMIFERDLMFCVDPADSLPIDREKLSQFRPTYCHLAYVQASRGVTVKSDHYGDDRPEELADFHRRETAWLMESPGAEA